MAQPKKPEKPQKGWINRTTTVSSLGISRQSFDAWKVQPVARIGREAFFTMEDVVAARVAHAIEKTEAKYSVKDSGLDDDSENGNLNPIVEKTKLDIQRRIGQELINQQTRGDLIPMIAIEFVMSKIGAEMAAIFDSLPAKIKKALPKTNRTQLDHVEKEITKARNIAANAAVSLSDFVEEHYRSTMKMK
jgi:phage terminase Nu1 subunit (DNA packaging protein)